MDFFSRRILYRLIRSFFSTLLRTRDISTRIPRVYFPARLQSRAATPGINMM